MGTGVFAQRSVRVSVRETKLDGDCGSLATGGGAIVSSGITAERLCRVGLISKELYQVLRTGAYFGTAFLTGIGLGYASGELWQWEWEWLNKKNGGG